MTKIPKIPILCACGCGEVVWNGRKYVHGHNANIDGFQMGHKAIGQPFQKGHKGMRGQWHWSGEARYAASFRHKGKKLSEETKRKISLTGIGRPSPMKGGHFSDEFCKKLSEAHKGKFLGEKHPRWRGGNKLSNARMHHKRRQRGFVLLVQNNPYNEPIDYHHIHPDLSYVVPCPTRIHRMFNGKSHFNNVNLMLGFKFCLEEN